MEWGPSPEFFMKKEGLDYEEYDLSDRSFLKKVSKKIKKISKVIKAAILIPEQLVLIDTDLHYAKKPFGQGHELGHNTIPEHKEILYVCSEHDLHIKVRKEMEFEANIFASEILYPTPLIESIHKNYPLSMATILLLKERSGGSIHSSAIKYVETSQKVCCLLILEKAHDDDGNRGLMFKSQQICSRPWWRKHKRLLADNQFFSEDHTLSSAVFSGSLEPFIKTELEIRGTDIIFQAHVFYNRFIVLALLFE